MPAGDLPVLWASHFSFSHVTCPGSLGSIPPFLSSPETQSAQSSVETHMPCPSLSGVSCALLPALNPPLFQVSSTPKQPCLQPPPGLGTATAALGTTCPLWYLAPNSHPEAQISQTNGLCALVSRHHKELCPLLLLSAGRHTIAID